MFVIEKERKVGHDLRCTLDFWRAGVKGSTQRRVSEMLKAQNSVEDVKREIMWMHRKLIDPLRLEKTCTERLKGR